MTSPVTVFHVRDGQLVRWLRAGGGGPVPATVPGAPTKVVGSATTASSAQVSWSPPALDGGSPVTGYLVSRDGANPWSTTVGASVRSQNFGNLTASTVYHLSVAAINAVGQGPTTTVAVTTAASGGGNTGERFPGDPNPRVTGRTWWGAAVGTNGSVAPHENAAGVPLAVRRRYWSAVSDIAVPNGPLVKAVREDHAANRLPCVSFKLTWATAGAGGYDGQMDALIAELESYAKPTWVILNHEPENDGGVAADFRRAQARFRARMDAYGAAHGGIKRIAFGGCLMTFTWNPTSGRNPEDWYPGAGVWDFIGNDHYTEANQAIERANPWGNFVTWAGGKKLPYCLPEWGLRKEDAQAATKMQAFYDDMLDGSHDCVGFMYFDSGANSTGSGWTLTDDHGLLDEFRSLMLDRRSLHLSDMGY